MSKPGLDTTPFYPCPYLCPIAGRTAALRAQCSLHTSDNALQLGAALVSGCQALRTNDARPERVTDLPVLALDELEWIVVTPPLIGSLSLTRFAQVKTLDQDDFALQPSLDRWQAHELARLGFSH